MQTAPPVTIKTVDWKTILLELKVGEYHDFPFHIRNTGTMRRTIKKIRPSFDMTARTLENNRGIRIWRNS